MNKSHFHSRYLYILICFNFQILKIASVLCLSLIVLAVMMSKTNVNRPVAIKRHLELCIPCQDSVGGYTCRTECAKLGYQLHACHSRHQHDFDNYADISECPSEHCHCFGPVAT